MSIPLDAVLEHNNKELNKRCDCIEAQLKVAEERHKTLEQQLAEAKAENTKLQGKLEEVEKERASWHSSAKQLAHEQSSLDDTIKQLKESKFDNESFKKVIQERIDSCLRIAEGHHNKARLEERAADELQLVLNYLSRKEYEQKKNA